MRIPGRALVACSLVGASCAGLLLYASSSFEGPVVRSRSTAQAPQLGIPESARGAPHVEFLAVGDTGWENEARSSVAAAMALCARNSPPDFVLLLGDNVYPAGVRSVDDPAWKVHFERAFAEPELQIPFYAALGNHDHAGNAQAEVEHALLDPRWRMPASYYAFSKPLAAGCEVGFFVLDTTPIRFGDHVADGQVRWLEDKLERSTARWKIVVGHHPLLSGGKDPGSPAFRSLLGPLFVRHGVDLYVSGHDHDLELIRGEGEILQVVSGAGSSPRSVARLEKTLYAEAEPGFVRVLATETDLWIQFVTAGGGARFTHHVERGP